MRIAGAWNPSDITAEMRERGVQCILDAFEAGYTLFDHADIYSHGIAEEIFGEALRRSAALRSQAIIATKCGIRRMGDPTPTDVGRYDFGAQHIITSCERSLQRLGVETIHLYQLHRPDLLMDPHEVASAFEKLRTSGKVQVFGVSNFLPSTLELLAGQTSLVSNQIEVSLKRLDPLFDGTLDQCITRNLVPMAWSPIGGSSVLDPANAVGQELATIAEELESTPFVIALAWLMRHPSGILPIVGSTRRERIFEAIHAAEISLSREHWYRLLVAARGERMP